MTDTAISVKAGVELAVTGLFEAEGVHSGLTREQVDRLRGSIVDFVLLCVETERICCEREVAGHIDELRAQRAKAVMTRDRRMPSIIDAMIKILEGLLADIRERPSCR